MQWKQVSRLGEPLINEVVIPLGKKDFWNSSDPADDSQFASNYLNPELAADINLLFPVVKAPEHNRTDLVAVLLTGLPPGNPFKLVTQIGKGKPAKADLLRLNLAVPPTPPDQQTARRAGRPGRRLPQRPSPGRRHRRHRGAGRGRRLAGAPGTRRDARPWATASTPTTCRS